MTKYELVTGSAGGSRMAGSLVVLTGLIRIGIFGIATFIGRSSWKL